eukprot:scpid45071/ scgid4556/ Dual specificity protein phosphatase 12; Glucokinase-associated dual specificity phosphatase
MPTRKMNNVRPHLFLGAASDALDEDQIVDNGITHILSLLSEPLPPLDCHGKVKFVPILDCDTADLLAVLEDCLEFVSSAVKSGGNVLVHCIAGVSRSSSVVIAYLMRTEKLNFYQAYKEVQKKRPIISPNDGFAEQLRLFEMTNCKVNLSHPMYKLMKMKIAIANSETGEFDRSKMSMGWLSSSNVAGPEDVVYRCRKCRSLLFSSEHVVTHPVGDSPLLYDGSSRVDGKDPKEVAAAQAEACKLTLHTMPLDWMEKTLEAGEQEGKLSCPKCNSRLGTYKWSGARCGCRFWVVPFFSFPRRRVDECAPIGQVMATARHSVPPQRAAAAPSAHGGGDGAPAAAPAAGGDDDASAAAVDSASYSVPTGRVDDEPNRD